ncbi:MAG: hypothetical protein ACD_46C00692G0002 [uncultured bacterium]|nr:MAG: hypothetical protein ACD_46C00692G0002 [uncultured bacterium]
MTGISEYRYKLDVKVNRTPKSRHETVYFFYRVDYNSLIIRFNGQK